MGLAGGFTLKMKDAEQAQTVFPIVHAHIQHLTNWNECLTISNRIISVDFDAYMETWEYSGVVLGFCKEIAQTHPDFEFDLTAYGYDDNDTYRCEESGSLENGEFRFDCYTARTAADFADLDDIDPEELDEMMDEFIETTVVTIGKLVDGKMIFSTQE